MKKKYTLMIICLILMLFLVSCLNVQSDKDYFLVQIIPDKNQNNTTEIANSLNLYLANLLCDCTDKKEINDKIVENWENIENLLNEYDLTYSAKITSKNFDEIVFENQSLHKGKYSTLVINFGEIEKDSQFLLYLPNENNGKIPIIKSRILQNLR